MIFIVKFIITLLLKSKKMNFKIIILFFFLACSLLAAQSKTNLEMINGLIDSSAIQVSSSITNLDYMYNLNINSIEEYDDLNQTILTSLVRKGVKLSLDSSEVNKINYSLTQVRVEYSDLFRDGLFGDYLLERNFILIGEYSIQNNSAVTDADVFNYSVKDTISYDDFFFVENNSQPFTKGKVPDAPFFPSILEPVVAITTVVVSVILFFSVRSK